MSYKKVDIEECINTEEFNTGEDPEEFSVRFFETADMVRIYNGVNFLKAVTMDDLEGEEESCESSENNGKQAIQDMSFQFEDDQKVCSFNLGSRT